MLLTLPKQELHFYVAITKSLELLITVTGVNYLTITSGQ